MRIPVVDIVVGECASTIIGDVTELLTIARYIRGRVDFISLVIVCTNRNAPLPRIGRSTTHGPTEVKGEVIVVAGYQFRLKGPGACNEARTFGHIPPQSDRDIVISSYHTV